MKGITDMAKSTREVEEAIRNDFNELPPEFQDHMLNLLAKVDPDNMDFWKTLLGLTMPNALPAL